MHPAGVAFLVIFLLLIAAGVGWILFTRIRAQRLGLPPPPLASYIPFLKSSSTPYGPPKPAPGGIVGWFNDHIRMFKNRNNRTAVGSYEQPLGGVGAATGGPSGGRSHRGFGPLDPDEAWDSRVGHEADVYGGPGGYYEEQELGLATPRMGGDTSYGGGGGGSSYQMNLATEQGAGASAGAGGRGYDDEHRGRTRSRSPGLAPSNPFDDHAEASNISMRGVSPRPIDTGVPAKTTQEQQEDNSPTGRRSIFREGV